MRIGYGAGAVIAILVPFVVYFLGIINLLQTFFLVFLLFGLWTLLATFTMIKSDQRNFYLSWGLLFAGVSFVFVIPIRYAIALIIVVVIVVILISYSKRIQK